MTCDKQIKRYIDDDLFDDVLIENLREIYKYIKSNVNLDGTNK